MVETLTAAAPRRSVWPYVAVTGILLGSNGLLSKALIDADVALFVVTGVPFAIAGVLAMTVAVHRRQLRGDALAAAILVGAVSTVMPGLLLNVGYGGLPAGIVTLLFSVAPVVTALTAHVVFADEHLNSTKLIGLGCAIAGVAVLASDTLSGGGSTTAVVATLGGTVVAGMGGPLNREVVLRHGASALIGPQLLTAATLPIGVGAVLGRLEPPPGGYEPREIALLGVAGISTYVGFATMMAANEVGTTGQLSLIGYFIPLFGVGGGIVFFGETLGLAIGVGGAMIIAAMTAIARGSAPTSDPSDPANRGGDRRPPPRQRMSVST